MIVVTGANGRLGRGVIDGLLDRLPAGEIVATVRDPNKATALAEQGIHVRSGDFAESAGLATAFAGAAQVLVVSVNQLGEPARRLHESAIEAARAAGARRVLYTSHMGARPDSPFAAGPDHAAAEEALAAAGLPFTALRHSFFAESAEYFIGTDLQAGEIRAPEDGPVSWTARADLAEADAILLAEEGRLDAATPPLTSGEAFTMAELAAIASELSGREIKRVVLTDEAWCAEQIARGMPSAMAELLLGMYRAARRGDFSATDPTLATLLGRRPKTMRDILADHLKRSEA